MSSLRQAFAFLTILPLGTTGPPSASARAWFPLVGLALGAALVGVDAASRAAMPPIVVGALLLAASLILTRALHAEGFLDCCDGLFGGYTAEDRLRILRDTHVGAFAVIGGATLLIVKWSLFASTPETGRFGLLLLVPCLGRFAMLLAMSAFPYARAQGVGSSLQRGSRWWQVGVGAVTGLVVAVLGLGLGGIVLLGAVSVIGLAVGRIIAGQLGGLTGDAYGTINELGEVTVLVLGVSLIPLAPSLFSGPI